MLYDFNGAVSLYMHVYTWKSDCLGCAVLLCLVVCLTLLAPSFSSYTIMCIYVYTCTRMHFEGSDCSQGLPPIPTTHTHTHTHTHTQNKITTGLFGAQAPIMVPDKSVTMCQACSAVFSFTFRRHHCRGCGKVSRRMLEWG